MEVIEYVKGKPPKLIYSSTEQRRRPGWWLMILMAWDAVLRRR
jgi:hypothetical protein